MASKWVMVRTKRAVVAHPKRRNWRKSTLKVKTMCEMQWFVKEDDHGIFIGAKPIGVYIRRGHVELGNNFKKIVGKPSEDYDQLA